MTTPFPPAGGPHPPGPNPGGPGDPPDFPGPPGEPFPTPPRRGRVWPVVVGVVVVAAVVLVVWLVSRGSGADDALPAPGTSSSSTAAEPSGSATQPEPSDDGTPSEGSSTPAPPPAAGCAPTTEQTPAGADVQEVVDVDGDGRTDEAWLTGGADRRFGITTASGATFSVAVASASPVPAAAVVQRVQDDGIPIALVDLSREALVYSLAGCAVTPVIDAQGQPYTFDRGFGTGGTGVGCTLDGGVLRLAGLDATSDDDGQTYTVERTFVDLDAEGRHATNGTAEVVAQGAAPDDPVVTTAQEVSCGELVAGQDGPVEPQQ